MIEAKIDELIAALDRAAETFIGITRLVVHAEQPAAVAAPKTKAKASKAAAPEQAQPAAAPAAPVTPVAPVTEPPAPSPAAPSPPKADPKLLLNMTNAIIRLANEYDHETAVGILAKRKVKRCSDVPESEWQAVLDEAEEAIARAQAAQATQSLV
jgi:hypothetical protein